MAYIVDDWTNRTSIVWKVAVAPAVHQLDISDVTQEVLPVCDKQETKPCRGYWN